MKKIIKFILFSLISIILTSCINFTSEPMTLKVEPTIEPVDFCKNNPTKCLENTEPNLTNFYPTPPTYCGLKYKDPKKPTHIGLDIASNSGDKPTDDMPINASWKGKVVKSSKDPDTVADPKKGLGNLVVVEYRYDDIPVDQRPSWLKQGDSVYIRYSHLRENDRISEGVNLEAGTMIGRVGSTGESSGSHIHLETRLGPSNTYSSFYQIKGEHDPLDVFPKICSK